MDLKDFPMAQGVLKKLATGGDKADANYVPATADDAKRNQDYADKKLKQSKSGSPLSTTMTPIAAPKKGK